MRFDREQRAIARIVKTRNFSRVDALLQKFKAKGYQKSLLEMLTQATLTATYCVSDADSQWLWKECFTDHYIFELTGAVIDRLSAREFNPAPGSFHALGSTVAIFRKWRRYEHFSVWLPEVPASDRGGEDDRFLSVSFGEGGSNTNIHSTTTYQALLRATEAISASRAPQLVALLAENGIKYREIRRLIKQHHFNRSLNRQRLGYFDPDVQRFVNANVKFDLEKIFSL